MYTIINFGKDLKKMLTKTSDIQEIADFCFDIMNYAKDDEKGVHDIACTLALMDAGPEFEYTIEELNVIADRLIKGDKTITQLGMNPEVLIKN